MLKLSRLIFCELAIIKIPFLKTLKIYIIVNPNAQYLTFVVLRYDWLDSEPVAFVFGSST